MAHAVAAVLFIWAGLLLGVAFVATPAKFLAPSLTLAQALDVGRWTFYVLAVIEWCIAIGVIALMLAKTASSRGPTWLCVFGVLAVLAAQTFGIRPILDARVLEIIAGRPVPIGPPWHALYVALEGAKLILLVTAGTGLLVGSAETAQPATAWRQWPAILMQVNTYSIEAD